MNFIKAPRKLAFAKFRSFRTGPKVKLLDRGNFDPCSPCGGGVAEGAWRIIKNREGNRVECDRREGAKVVRSGKFLAVEAINRNASQSDAQPSLLELLRVAQVGQAGAGRSDVGGLNREDISHDILGELPAKINREADVELSPRPSDQLLGVEQEVRAKKCRRW